MRKLKTIRGGIDSQGGCMAVNSVSPNQTNATVPQEYLMMCATKSDKKLNQENFSAILNLLFAMHCSILDIKPSSKANHLFFRSRLCTKIARSKAWKVVSFAKRMVLR